MDTRSAICSTKLPLRMDKCHPYILIRDNLCRRNKGAAPNVSACMLFRDYELMFSGVHEAIIKLILYMKPEGPNNTSFIMDK